MNALNSQEVMPPAKPQAYSTPLSMVLQQAQHFTSEYPVVPIMYKGQEHMISSKQFNQLLKMTKRRETEAMLQEQHRRRSGPKRPSLRTIAAINRSRVVGGQFATEASPKYARRRRTNTSTPKNKKISK